MAKRCQKCWGSDYPCDDCVADIVRAREIADLEDMIGVDPEHEGAINRRINAIQAANQGTRRTRYEVQIKYPNRPDEWHTYYESADTMTQASILMLRAQARFPKNEFRVEPITVYR